jgi:hypothetical protein
MKPSEIKSAYWLYRANDFYFHSTSRTGKWIIEVPLDKLDETWAKVDEALMNFQLGPAAKASTAMENSTQAQSHKNKIIVVYVNDYVVEEHTLTVLKGLRDIGITGKLKFKRDAETFSGTYGKNSFWMYSNKGTEVKRYKWTKRWEK